MAKSSYECPKCGAKIVVVGRNRADADNYAAWLLKQGRVCDDCLKEERRERSRLAAEEAKEAGLPALKGSPAQVRWAETIRKDALDRVDAAADGYIEQCRKAKGEEGAEKGAAIIGALKEVLGSIDVSSVWIEQVGQKNFEYLLRGWREEVEELLERGTFAGQKQEIPEDVREEAMIRPENPISTEPVVVEIDKNEVRLEHGKDERMIAVAKNLKYRWEDYQWRFDCRGWRGPAVQRGAEVIVHMLAAGFTVLCFNEEARQLALSGEYEPMTYRWLTAYEAEDKIGLICEDGSDVSSEVGKTFWQVRKHGPFTSSYMSKADRYEAILDFAARMDFKITPKAQELLDAARKRIENALLVKDVKVKKAAAPNLKTELEDSFEIDDSLKDD